MVFRFLFFVIIAQLINCNIPKERKKQILCNKFYGWSQFKCFYKFNSKILVQSHETKFLKTFQTGSKIAKINSEETFARKNMCP